MSAGNTAGSQQRAPPSQMTPPPVKRQPDTWQLTEQLAWSDTSPAPGGHAGVPVAVTVSVNVPGHVTGPYEPLKLHDAPGARVVTTFPPLSKHVSDDDVAGLSVSVMLFRVTLPVL